MCDQAPETVYGSIVADKVNSDTDLAQAVGQIVYTAQAIMENAADKVGGHKGGGAGKKLSGTVQSGGHAMGHRVAAEPQWLGRVLMLEHHALPPLPPLRAVSIWRPAQLPGGLPHPAEWQRTEQHQRGRERDGCVPFKPVVQAKAMVCCCHPAQATLLPRGLGVLHSPAAGLTQSCRSNVLNAHPTSRPSVAVLANSGEVFSSLPSALPTFDQWLNYSAGVNINKTIAVGGSTPCNGFALLQADGVTVQPMRTARL